MIQLILIINKTVMSQQASNLQQQIKNLRDQLKAIRQNHQYTMLQLIQSRQNEEKLKKINDTLTKTIENSTINLPKIEGLNIVIQGELTSKRIAELQRQLEHYRNGVNASVDRRVRQIVKEYSQLEEEEKSKSRLSYGDRNNISINYNLVKNQKQISQNYQKNCQKCHQYECELSQKNKQIQQLNVELEQVRADSDILRSKLNKLQALVDTLKKENQLLELEINRLQNYLQQVKQPQSNNKRQNTDQTYNDDRYEKNSSRISYGRNGPYECKDKQNMMRQITNIANVFSNRKQAQQRGKSRVMPIRDSNALFSIKNGINRPSQIYF